MARVLQIHLPKPPAIRAAGNWETRHLSDEQQRYAGDDARAGLLVYLATKQDQVALPSTLRVQIGQPDSASLADVDNINQDLLERMETTNDIPTPVDLLPLFPGGVQV